MTAVIHLGRVNIEWGHEAVAHMWERHGVTPDAEEAIDDLDVLPRSPIQ
jgi:hypothetical protein